MPRVKVTRSSSRGLAHDKGILMSTSTDPASTKQESQGIDEPEKQNEIYQLRLYITGMSRQSMQALTNLKQVCDKHLVGQYELKVIDLQRPPESIEGDGFVVAPMLVKRSPLPVCKLVGNLANTQELLRRLGIDEMVSVPNN